MAYVLPKSSVVYHRTVPTLVADVVLLYPSTLAFVGRGGSHPFQSGSSIHPTCYSMSLACAACIFYVTLYNSVQFQLCAVGCWSLTQKEYQQVRQKEIKAMVLTTKKH
jgi:hypothetical protein